MAARKMKGTWWIDLRWKSERIRKKSPVDTKRGAEEYERQLRQARLDGTFRKEATAAVPTVEEFSKEFLSVYAEANNKPLFERLQRLPELPVLLLQCLGFLKRGVELLGQCGSHAAGIREIPFRFGDFAAG